MDVAWVHDSPEPADDQALSDSLHRAGSVVLSSLIEHQAGAGWVELGGHRFRRDVFVNFRGGQATFPTVSMIDGHISPQP